MEPYITKQEKKRLKRQEQRRLAIIKIANETDPKCAVCGCPHEEVLHIGHMKHRGGRWHRKEEGCKGSRGMVSWVLRTDIKTVLERVQLECPYCNAYHNRTRGYPEGDKRPYWNIQEMIGGRGLL